MIEKVNPQHPDKVADRIAWAIVDYAYTKDNNPKIAVEVLIWHWIITIIVETSVNIPDTIIKNIVNRISWDLEIKYIEVPQDKELAKNQETIKAWDNWIFKWIPTDEEVKELSYIAHNIYSKFPTDGKYILDKEAGRLIICQSQATNKQIEDLVWNDYDLVINPLWEWTWWINVDTWATNRKLWSDMWRAVTWWWLHGKDLSKADVSVNIYAHIKAQEENREIDICCAIWDNTIDWKKYSEIVEIAKEYIKQKWWFEKFAEWWIV